ncbi:MAG TPA: hypothetical protein VEP66_07070 [Myxococcales bacterium]|nr:hypothetical protein [Myxococcales bacterium]
MAKQTGKGSRHQRRVSALERKATKHREPRTVDEAMEIARDVPEKLREKARERMGKLPEPAKQALRVAESAVAVLFVPIRLGFHIAREAVLLPFHILRSLRQREV